MSEQDKGLAQLREPFAPEAVGKIPKNIGDGAKRDCRVCGGYHGPAGLHLDYVGHAGITDRLLSVDPHWTWEPFALDDRGLPALDRDKDGWPRGLWIKLTVCGVTRPGYGTCEARKTDACKELIGDALRNAAMRFGVALDLWSKTELESSLESPGGGHLGEVAPTTGGKPKTERGADKTPGQAATSAKNDSGRPYE